MNTPAWPPLNKKAWLRLPCCNEEHPTRVEDIVGNDIVVAAPQAPHLEPVPSSVTGKEFFLGWTMGRGALEVPVGLVSEDDSRVPLWRVTAVGEPIETQRRRYVRVEVTCDTTLYLVENGAPIHTLSQTLSEGGLSCTVDRWAIDPGTRSFGVQVQLGPDAISLRGTIAWWGNLDGDSLRSVGVEFHDTPRHIADAIRSWVFSRQLEQRRHAS